MADPDSPDLIFRRALASYLASIGAGVYVTNRNYTTSERGIFTNGPDLPTLSDNCVVLSSLRTLSDGRADLVRRVQIYGRVRGNNIAAGNLHALIWAGLDQKENVPPGLNVSWAWEFSSLDFSADTNGRCGFASTYYFRARR